MKKYNCLIIDDEPLAVLLLESYAKKSKLFQHVFANTDINKCIEILEKETIDLVFLDIQMPQLTGFEFMTLFKDKTFILTTAYPDYALDAFKFNVIEYLLKPITFEVFINSINKFNKYNLNKNHDNEVVTFRADRKIHLVEISNIIYIEGLKDYIKVHTNTEKIMFLANMKDVISRLPSGEFIRIHRSYIVPVNKIKIIDGHSVVLKNNLVLAIGETYRDKIMSMFNS